ncbi:DNA damage checkpoint protein [Scheffersomyces xylosifermentans]|uniref:DNA damage checkpoint protein n=1 Tax=Scheffersomyces xylosifermentans TaxID=1304137 RepID=UPI00315C89EC
MSSSGSDFDDDDDELLQAVITGRATSKLYRAEGEVAILRAQLNQIQRQKQDEIFRLRDSHNQFRKSNEDQVSALKYAVQKLEDEKKFLNNELKTTSHTKRRKLASESAFSQNNGQEGGDTTGQLVAEEPAELPHKTVSQQIFQLQQTTSFFADQIWNHCIIGSDRTSLNYLDKISIHFDIHVRDLKIAKRTPVSSAIVEFLMLKKSLRLDELVEDFCLSLVEVVEILQESKTILAIPFLLSFIHCSITFRPAAITPGLIEQLLRKFSHFSNSSSFLLNSNLNEEDYINYHDVPNQVMILEKFFFICCLDIVEKLVSVSTLHGTDFIRRIWNDDILSTELLNRCLPENTERFKNSAQINVVFNVVEMLIASTTEDTFAFNVGTNSSIFSSLLKIFLIELPIKDDFMFYGLNRILGNNIDFRKIDATIPQTADILNNFSVLIPQPIPFELIEQNQENEAIRFELLSNHEFHLLNLRIKVADLLESYIIAKQSVEFLQHKEHFKSIIRIINFEQMYIIRSPRSKYIHLRIQIVSKLVKVLNYLTQDTRDLGNFIYPETMYELFVALSRIAFGSDSLSGEAHKLLLQVRSKGYVKDPIFNSWCEDKARELNHITNDDLQGKLLADLESDYANGLEFPYETDTVELAREILNIFVTHEEADNLYFNMKYEPDQGYDEMEFE